MMPSRNLVHAGCSKALSQPTFFGQWKTPAGVDLDWFWRSWFYTTEHVDISVTGFTRHTLDLQDPDEKDGR
jgi:hypothetical protein